MYRGVNFSYDALNRITATSTYPADATTSYQYDGNDVIVTDAMCTVACGSDFDCPGDGLCFAAATGPALCYEPCFDDFDCPIDFGCVQDVDLFAFEPVCMPI